MAISEPRDSIPIRLISQKTVRSEVDALVAEVDSAVGDLLSAMEPMIIMFLGVVVGGIVISMYMPMFAMIGKLAQ